jgi:hypothetical protein
VVLREADSVIEVVVVAAEVVVAKMAPVEAQEAAEVTTRNGLP